MMKWVSRLRFRSPESSRVAFMLTLLLVFVNLTHVFPYTG